MGVVLISAAYPEKTTMLRTGLENRGQGMEMECSARPTRRSHVPQAAHNGRITLPYAGTPLRTRHAGNFRVQGYGSDVETLAENESDMPRAESQEPEFTDPHTVGVTAGGDSLTVTAETILIDTGAEPIIPDIPGLRASKRTLTSTDLIQTSQPP
ncbi:hypothetical protein ITP53_24700 [Nonomuraea sp. K274]|uniref:Uncharacterized protein n=1 Tax=Nonomuraea cypriaca TaxID=1187855 RepID=A0A931AD44_9ACTN|nr:hypothetical protein [Nonomuraea cypriaca]MBF8188874.1 hypothetical protein [Nonomuraea cypriaca]